MPDPVIGLTVGGGLIGSKMASKASKSAAGTAAAATDRASEAQLEMYRQTRQDMLPALEARDYALDRLIGKPVYETAPPGEFTESPGYQFMVSEADKASKRRLASQGLLGSGHALTEASRQGVGLASQDYWNWRQNALNEWLTTQLNPLQSMAGLGQTAAGQLGNIGYQTGAGIGSNIVAGGQAQALGRVAGAQAWQQGLQGVGNALAGADWSNFGKTTPTATQTPAFQYQSPYFGTIG